VAHARSPVSLLGAAGAAPSLKATRFTLLAVLAVVMLSNSSAQSTSSNSRKSAHPQAETYGLAQARGLLLDLYLDRPGRIAEASSISSSEEKEELVADTDGIFGL